VRAEGEVVRDADGGVRFLSKMSLNVAGVSDARQLTAPGAIPEKGGVEERHEVA
jgi:hypothetical protein